MSKKKDPPESHRLSQTWKNGHQPVKASRDAIGRELDKKKEKKQPR